MREVTFEFPPAGGGTAKYPWDEILNGQTWELVQGEDFEMEPRTFVAHIHGTAKRKGMKVRTHTKQNKIIIRAFQAAAAAVSVAPVTSNIGA